MLKNNNRIFARFVRQFSVKALRGICQVQRAEDGVSIKFRVDENDPLTIVGGGSRG